LSQAVSAPDVSIVVDAVLDSPHLASFAAQQASDAIVLGALSHRRDLTSLVGLFTGHLVEALTCDFVLVKAPEAADVGDRMPALRACSQAIASS